MEGNSAVIQLRTMQHFFKNSISVLEESDSGYRPGETGWTVAQQMRHTAITIGWFTDGVFSGKGFDENWEEQNAFIDKATSFEEELASFDRAVDQACETWGALSEEELGTLLPENPIMGRVPRRAVVGGIVDHTAHHRGALATYARVMGKVPQMPW